MEEVDGRLAAIAAGLAPLAVQQPAHAYDSVVAMLQSPGARPRKRRLVLGIQAAVQGCAISCMLLLFGRFGPLHEMRGDIQELTLLAGKRLFT